MDLHSFLVVALATSSDSVISRAATSEREKSGLYGRASCHLSLAREVDARYLSLVCPVVCHCCLVLFCAFSPFVAGLLSLARLPPDRAMPTCERERCTVPPVLLLLLLLPATRVTHQSMDPLSRRTSQLEVVDRLTPTTTTAATTTTTTRDSVRAQVPLTHCSPKWDTRVIIEDR